jgi:hypothetical protein
VVTTGTAGYKRLLVSNNLPRWNHCFVVTDSVEVAIA